MSARDEAVAEQIRSNKRRMSIADWVDVTRMLNRACDVYEPLLQQAFTALERSTPRGGEVQFHQDVLDQIRKALAP